MLTTLKEHIRDAHVEWVREVAKEEIDPETNPILREEDLPVIDKLKAEEASVAEARSALEEKIGRLPPEIEERLEDLEHFDETGELRRPSVPPWSGDEKDDVPSESDA